MNTAKQNIIDMVNQLPDDIQDESEVVNRLALETRIREGNAEYEKNGGIPHEEVVRYMEEKMKRWGASDA